MENFQLPPELKQDNPNNLDNLELAPSEYPSKRRSFKYWSKIVGLIVGILAIVTVVFFSYKIFSAGEKIFLGKNDHSIIKQLKRLILPTDGLNIKKEERVNVLLVGIRGTGHGKDQGGGVYLADTIILLSLKPQTKELAMLSIPRDLWVDLGDYGHAKINAAYAYGLKEDRREGGAHLLTKTIEEFTGVPIDYFVAIDFAGFEKAIDTIGGVDITVDRAFTDYFYPTWNYEYQTISFQAGPQHMDGDTALKFVRSRHGTNGEGSDFARAQRQQKVLAAAKEKIFSISTILNPVKITKLIDSMENHLLTNLDLSRAKEIIQITQEIDPNKIIHHVLDDSRDGYLVSSRSETGASILVPRSGDFSEIKMLAQNIFDPTYKKTLSAQEVRKEEEKIKVQVRNGTATVGLAGKTAVELKEAGYEIVGILNADSQDYEKTVIFDHTEGKQEEALEDLKKRLNANVAAGRSFFLERSSSGSGGEADFVIILGKDQNL